MYLLNCATGGARTDNTGLGKLEMLYQKEGADKWQTLTCGNFFAKNNEVQLKRFNFGIELVKICYLLS